MAESVEPAAVPVFQSNHAVVSVVTGTVQILKADPKRYAVILVVPLNTLGMTWCIGGSGVTAFQVPGNSSAPLEILWQKHGPLCQEEVWLINTAGNSTISYFTLTRV